MTARVELADRLRALHESAVTNDADDATFRRAAALIDQALDVLGDGRSAAEHRAWITQTGARSANPYDSAENPTAAPLYVVDNSGGLYTAQFTLSPVFEGPPGRVHGGVVAGILDHASGFAVHSLDIPAMSVSITVDLRDATPYGEPLTVTARVGDSSGRKMWVDGAVSTADGRVTATCRTLMITVA
ncbi:MAG: PaaI family thioesterase [Mycobacterium sp.]|nr:PaaI family thioesterase [Mycobacterium sp.]